MWMYVLKRGDLLHKNGVDWWKFSHEVDWEPKLSNQQANSILKDIYPSVQGLSFRSFRKFCCKRIISSGVSSEKVTELVMYECVYANGLSFLYSEIANFKVASKRQFGFLQRNTKF